MTEAKDTVILRKSEYDIFAVPDLEAELLPLTAQSCTIDFRHVAYIDSSGVNVLIRLWKRLGKLHAKAHIRFINVSMGLKRIFRITQMTQLFDIE